MSDRTRIHAKERRSATSRARQEASRASRKPAAEINPALVIQRAVASPQSELSRLDILALQRTAGNRAVQRLLETMPSQTVERSSHEGNLTGMPDQLKAGIEALSGMDMTGLRVHANSSKPARIKALAFTQGNEIHLGPGQERHLAHEAWHVVQQHQGRVSPTARRNHVAINDSPALEQEATVMGEKAMQLGSRTAAGPLGYTGPVPIGATAGQSPNLSTVQCLDDNSVAYFLPKDPFTAEFKTDHIVETDTDLTAQVAENRRGNKASNTIVLMTKDQGLAELKGALKALAVDKEEDVKNKEHTWDTKEQYQWKKAVRNAAGQQGTSKHKLGMKHQVTVTKPATKRKAAETVEELRITHYESTA